MVSMVAMRKLGAVNFRISIFHGHLTLFKSKIYCFSDCIKSDAMARLPLLSEPTEIVMRAQGLLINLDTEWDAR
jgi:hypothetical protein